MTPYMITVHWALFGLLVGLSLLGLIFFWLLCSGLFDALVACKAERRRKH